MSFYNIVRSLKNAPASTLYLAILDEILDKPLIHSFLLTNDPKTRQFGYEITSLNVAYFLG